MAPVHNLRLRVLLDSDQGVDHEGHSCHLILSPEGEWLRRCLVVHAEYDGETYLGLPLLAEHVTLADIDSALVAKFGSFDVVTQQRDVLIWLRDGLAEREGLTT